MSEFPEYQPPSDSGAEGGGLSGLAYGIFGALSADLGCIIGAAGFVILIVLSVVFAAAITPCTSAGGIPCAH
ncbi:MAG TPA: hypothetical protein VG245_10965 [Candidatus Dormibacteraeota bacterium]|jgi:hypothetical protein|nr:hypothetical protein [Candidatus Dormibacteraeota bacterium]